MASGEAGESTGGTGSRGASGRRGDRVGAVHPGGPPGARPAEAVDTSRELSGSGTTSAQRARTAEAEGPPDALERATIRRIVAFGAVFETAFVALDVYTSIVVYPGTDVGRMVALRLVAVAICLGAYGAALRLESLAALRRLTFAAFAATATLVALQATVQAGLSSRYLHGVWIISLYYVVAFPRPWWGAFSRGAAIVAAFPLVLGAAGLFDARIASQWSSRATLAVFVEEYFFVLVTVALAAGATAATFRARRALLAHERERTRQRERAEATMELHDGATAALQRALMLLERSDERADMPVREAVEDALHETRTMMSLLASSPATWSELAARARRELESACDLAGIDVSFEALGDGPALPPSSAHDVLRIVREAATNVVRHSGARHVWCRCALDGGTLRLDIEDDGCGGTTARAAQGRGLSILARRAGRNEGRLEVLERPGGGTTLRAVLRVAAPAEGDAP